MAVIFAEIFSRFGLPKLHLSPTFDIMGFVFVPYPRENDFGVTSFVVITGVPTGVYFYYKDRKKSKSKSV